MAARILVVEDNLTNLELMTYLLQAYGHTPLTAGDGEQGLEVAGHEALDLILCDISLPGMDGYEVARRLGDHPDLGTIPLVAVTAMAMVGDRERVLAAGFDGYISKPIDPLTFVPQAETFFPVQRRSAPLPAWETAVASPPIATPPSRATILIVDDSSANLEVFRCTLEPFGFEVVAAETVEEGLALARQRPPDLIISDLHLGGQTGLDFLEAAKSDTQINLIPFIFLSASVDSRSDQAHGLDLDLGAIRFVLRPIDPLELVEIIETCLRGPKES